MRKLLPERVYASPVDPVSRVSLIKILPASRESRAARHWRLEREQAQLMHHRFWTVQNQRFQSAFSAFQKRLFSAF